jgi:3-oxoacyl-[acyl-carrier protein] reductase
MEIQEKAALITGTRRLGASIAVDLAGAGMNLCLIYRESREAAENAVTAIKRMGRKALAVQADLADPEQIPKIVNRAAEALGRLDVLVNAASIWKKTPVPEAGLADWNTNMDVNARAAYLLAREATPHMKKAGGGHVINFTDWLPASNRPRYRGYAAYYASKAALIAATEALALELAPDNILVNAIAPGPIRAQKEISPEENDEVLRTTPLGRWGGDVAVCQAVRALLMCDFVTGETIRVDGGRHLR